MHELTQRNRSSRAIPGGTGGVTTVELVVALVIGAILVAVALPLFTTTVQLSRLDGAARQIAGDLRRAQSLAVTRGGWFRLYSGTDSCTTQSGQSRYRIQQSINGGGTWTAFTECYLLSSEFPGATLTSITSAGGVQFNSRGACQNCAGADVLVTVSTPSGARTLQVRPTGSVWIP
ncbi:MAG: hypothetical protein L0214_08365 [candidate division NC10 bacterium]|nr:hypothetical protein [candidate division NC10 bacterium]